MLYFIKDLFYLFPAAFFLFLIRELLRNWLFSYSTFNKNKKIIKLSLVYMDPVSISLMSFCGLGWGGIIVKNRKDNFNTFIFSQIIYLFLFVFIYIYFRLNNTEETTYVFRMLSNMAMMSYTLFVLNWIPIPPFDFSYWYMQKNLHLGPFQFILLVFKIVTILFFFITGFNKNFLFYDTVFNLLISI